MPPHKHRSLVDPRVCSRIISIAEVDRRHVAHDSPRKAASFVDLARTACARTTCRKLRHGGQAGVAVAAVGNVPGSRVRRRPMDLSAEGVLGSEPRGVGALREVGVLGASELARFGGLSRRCDIERQRYVRPARALPNKRAPVCCTPFSVAAPHGRTKRIVASDRDAQSRRYLGSNVLATAHRRRRRVLRSQRV